MTIPLALGLFFAAASILAALFVVFALRQRRSVVDLESGERVDGRRRVGEQIAADLCHVQHALLTGTAPATASRDSRPSYASSSGWS